MTSLIGIKRRCCRAMTLVEVLLAVAMLGVGLVTVSGALLSSFDAAGTCANRLFAADVLSGGVAEIQLFFDQPQNLAMTVPRQGTVRGLNRDFFWLLRVENSDELSGVCTIQAQVNWRENGRLRELSRSLSLVRNLSPAEAL